MIINNRDFFDGIYLTTQPDVVDGTRCMHVEPPLFPAVEYEGRTVYVVRAWRSKQLLDDDPALPIETCDSSLFSADQLKEVWSAIESNDLSRFSPSAQYLISQDIAAGLDAETITLMRGGIIGDFVGFTIEEAKQFKPELFALIEGIQNANQSSDEEL